MGANIGIEILTPPTVEPVVLTDMKTYLNVDYSDLDTMIGQFITRARKCAEGITRRSLAPQIIRATIEPDPIAEGELSGPIGGDFDPYRLNERITTVPFGFYGPMFELPRHPVSQIQIVEYQLTPFDGQPASTMVWTNLPAADDEGNANWLLDTNTQPHMIALRPLLVANRYRFTYSAGYNNTSGYNTGPVPDEIIDQIMAWVGFRFDNRQGQPIPIGITQALAARRIWML